jgi:hypothetical protein
VEIVEARQSMKTPLRKAIQSRRKSLQSNLVIVNDLAAEEQSGVIASSSKSAAKKSMKTPLRRAI